MFARIYRPAKTAMQSGKSKADHWVLEFEQQAARQTDPLMGWTSGSDMDSNQVRLTFETKDAAIAYAKERQIPHQVMDRDDPKPVIKTYADNFAFRRRVPWTH